MNTRDETPNPAPVDLAAKILAVYAEAAHELAGHVSAAVCAQRGETHLPHLAHEKS